MYSWLLFDIVWKWLLAKTESKISLCSEKRLICTCVIFRNIIECTCASESRDMHLSSKSLVYVKLYCLSAGFYTFLKSCSSPDKFIPRTNSIFFIVPEKLLNLYSCSIYRNLSNYLNSFKFLFLRESRGWSRYTTFLLHIKIIFVFSNVQSCSFSWLITLAKISNHNAGNSDESFLFCSQF